MRLWLGSRDDYIGGSDTPFKEVGDFNSAGAFVKASGSTNSGVGTGRVLRVSSGAEGLYVATPDFHGNLPNGKTVISTCCTFSNSYNKDPSSSPTSTGLRQNPCGLQSPFALVQISRHSQMSHMHGTSY